VVLDTLLFSVSNGKRQVSDDQDNTHLLTDSHRLVKRVASIGKVIAFVA